MTRHHIRAWAAQTLYDAGDHWIEAASPEEAARIYRDEIAAAEAGEAQAGDARDADGQHLRIPDPSEIIDGERGYVLLDEAGQKLRDVDPDAEPASAEPRTEIAQLRAQVADCRALLADCRALLAEWQETHVWNETPIAPECAGTAMLALIDAALDAPGEAAPAPPPA